MADMQRVFERSVVNGAPYTGDQLPAQPIEFPRGTFLQRRRAALAAKALACQRCASGEPATFRVVSDISTCLVCSDCAAVAQRFTQLDGRVGRVTVERL